MQLGLIVLWEGAINDIPLGWHLCDGEKGTVDLRDLFVVGAGDSYAPADTGGSNTHPHTFTSDGHTHTIPSGDWIEAGPIFKAETCEVNALAEFIFDGMTLCECRPFIAELLV